MTGLYYNRFRYYDSSTGSYISQDPIGLAGNNHSLYVYVYDPNGWVDVLGLFPFFRGARAGEAPSFEPRAGEYKINKETGLVQPTHGVSVFNNPDSVSEKGFVPHEVQPDTVPDSLKIEQRGKDPNHYEIMPKEAMSETDYKEALSEIKCSN